MMRIKIILRNVSDGVYSNWFFDTKKEADEFLQMQRRNKSAIIISVEISLQ